MKIIFTALSKKIFYHRGTISKYVLENEGIPINPFMNFDYYFYDSIEREKIREANNQLVKFCDELWVFGEVSDGIEREINIAESNKKPIRYFSIDDYGKIIEINKQEVRKE